MKVQESRYAVSVVLPLWVTLFCFATVMGLLFQKLILPNIPALHAGSGLMHNDAIYFHQVAEAMAAKIQAEGWSWANIWPSATGARGNVAILAILYALFGIDPSLILPINAAMHASAGILLMMIVQLLCPGPIGRVAGAIAAILFVVFPSSLNWYAQVHKDGYAIAGTLLVLYAWLRFFMHHDDRRSVTGFVLASLIGMLLVLFVRPYNTLFLVVATGLWILVATLLAMFGSAWRKQWRYFITVVIVWLVFGAFAAILGSDKAEEANAYNAWSASQSDPEICRNWSWQSSSWLPAEIERYAETAARTRAGLICVNFDAASTVDRERLPQSVAGIVAYMPRALTMALFGPFPDMWFNPPSMARLVGALELLIWYLLVPGVFLAFRYYESKGLMLCLLFALIYLAIYGFTIGNMGTLHRVRYPFLQLLMAVGVLGWLSWIVRTRFYQRHIKRLWSSTSEVGASVGIALINSDEETAGKAETLSRKRMAGGGVMVAMVTLLSFLGFFFRDVLIAHRFGIGEQMDAFFIAMLIPMFLVNVFGQSFGSTSVSIYMREQAAGRERLAVACLAWRVTIMLLAICILLALLAPFYLPVLGWSFTADTLESTRRLLFMALPLLLFSGMVVLGNAILSARMHFSVPAWSQAVVPLFAIAALFAGGEEIGVMAVVIGMVAGQLVNLLLVQYYLRQDGLSVMPRPVRQSYSLPEGSRAQFVSLMLAALFLQISLLVDNGMASSLGAGNVAALGLGYKVIFFVTGIIGTGISVVLLPYFSSFVINRDMVSGRQELSLLMTLATLLGIGTSLIIYFISPSVMHLLFTHENINVRDIDTVVRVIHMGILQIPFFACQTILIKYAIATHDNRSILVSSLIGMIMNVVLNYVLMQRMGVAGIAAATTLSMFIGAAVLLWMVHRKGNMLWLDVLLSGLVWILYLTMMACIHFGSDSGVIVSAIAMLLGIFILNSEKALLNQRLADISPEEVAAHK